MKEYLYAWEEWYDRDTLSAKIAKDIDLIQAVYTFGEYFNTYPELFDEERTRNWLNEERAVKTETGKRLFEKYVRDNPSFKRAYDFAYDE